MPYKLPVLRESAGLRYFTFSYLYFMQGIPAGFALNAITNYLVASGVSAAGIGSFDAVIGLPWIVQFIWGPLIDRFQFSAMGNRKHWVMLSQLLAFGVTLSLLWVSDPVRQITLVMMVFCCHSIFASIQDASVDGTAIAITPEQERGRLNAYMRVGMLLGIAVGAAGLSTILHIYSFHTAALCQSAILLALTLLTYITKIDRSDSYLPVPGHTAYAKAELQEGENPNLKWLFHQLYKGIVHRDSLGVFGIIALVYLCLSIFTRSFNFQLIHTLRWSDNQLSVLQGTWGSLVTIMITLTGGYIADRFGASKLQKVIIICLSLFFIVFCSMGQLWIHKPVSITGVMVLVLSDPIFSVAAVPVLMALCYSKVEGSQFTTYMAIINLFDVLGAKISGWGMSVTTAPVIGFVCGITIVISLLAMAFYRRKKEMMMKFST